MGGQSLSNRLGALALAITDQMADKVRDKVGTYGSDTFAIVLIYQKKSLRMDTLARQLRLAHSSTVRVVDRLEAAGYVARRPGTDKRAVLLSLTREGTRFARQIMVARLEVLDELIDDLTDAETAALAPIIDLLLTKLTTDVEAGEHICRSCDEGACVLAQCPVERRYLSFEGALSGPEI